jgi:hypothetical protein
MANPKNHWTVKHGNDWAVKQEGNPAPLAIYQHQSDAWQDTINRAKRSEGEALLQNRHGQIRERNTYGKDTFPPRG